MTNPTLPCRDLKPCPFCGGSAVIRGRDFAPSEHFFCGEGGYFVACTKCFMTRGASWIRQDGEQHSNHNYASPEEAAEAWNTRDRSSAPEVSEAVALARRFHETYERLAPSFGYETRKETRAFDPESPNGRLMIAVCKEIIGSDCSNAKAGEVEWREMDSAPENKVIMGAWFGSPEYVEVCPVIYCSERGKWMNPSDLRDDEFTKPDMWQPYPTPPTHRALSTQRGDGSEMGDGNG